MTNPIDNQVDILLDDAEHIDFDFGQAAANKPWPDQDFTRKVAAALDVVVRHAHIQSYLEHESAGDVEHATLRKNFDPFLVFPFTEYQEGQPHRWSSYDAILVDERVDSGRSDYSAFEKMKYRLKDYPEAVEALSVLQKIATREKEWKDAIRASTTPDQSYHMCLKFREALDSKDMVAIPHSEVSNSPRTQIARMQAVGMKKPQPPNIDILLP